MNIFIRPMKIFYVSLAVVTLMFLIPSCKKEKGEPFGIPKIKTITNGANTRTFSYGNTGRVTKIVSNSIETVVTYYNDSMVYQSTPRGGTTTYILDSRGYVVSNDQDLNYSIDTDGHLISKTSPIDTYNYTWVNGNQATLNHYTPGGQSSETFTFLANTINTIGSDNQGASEFGKSSKNLINTYSYEYSGGISSYQYTYEYDVRGRVSKLSITDIGTSASTTTTYTYY
jgi:hypothetical protein